MKTLYRSSLGLIGALALAGAAYAQVPSTNDRSDAYQNTGMGSGALVKVTPGTYPTGYDNTASGYAALFENTTGYSNTASGYEALASNTTGSYNTASGYWALNFNTNGYYKTASWTAAL